MRNKTPDLKYIKSDHEDRWNYQHKEEYLDQALREDPMNIPKKRSTSPLITKQSYRPTPNFDPRTSMRNREINQKLYTESLTQKYQNSNEEYQHYNHYKNRNKSPIRQKQ